MLKTMQALRMFRRLACLAAVFALAVTVVGTAAFASEDEPRRLTGTLTGEQVVAGDSVLLYEATLGDLFVAGGEVSADRVTAGDVIAAGGSLRLHSRTWRPWRRRPRARWQASACRRWRRMISSPT